MVTVIVIMMLLVPLAGCVMLVMHAEERRREQSFRVWHAAARELGLAFSGPEHQRSITGTLNGVPVRADFRRETHGAGKMARIEEKTTFSAGGEGRIPPSLAVRHDSTLRSLGRLIHGRDEPVGDQRFDDRVEVSTMDAWVCAALSDKARRQLLRLLELGGEARQGVVSYERVGSASHETAWLVQMLQFFSHLAELLTVTNGSLHQRLAHNAVSDPSPDVRLQNLRFLADPSTHTPFPLLASTARALLSDEHVPVRLMAAMQLRPEGNLVLSALAANPEVETALRVQALRELGAEGAAGLEPLIAKLLGPSPPELVCAALTIIAARRLDSFSAAVVECTASEHEQVRVAAATALGRLSENGAEEALIRLLSDSSSEVQCASAESLGVIGSVAAVEPLLPLAERFGRAQLRQAARGAIGRIQSRLGNAEEGSLSLADDHELAGAVAIADAAEAMRVGQVSLAEDTGSRHGSMPTDWTSPPSSLERGRR
jgi:HEAT repeats